MCLFPSYPPPTSFSVSNNFVQIDFDMFTILTGHPNSANARKRFGEIKKRVRDQVFGAGGVDPASVSSTPRKRKTKRDDDSASPTKKSKVTKVEDEDPGVLEDALKTEQVDE